MRSDDVRRLLERLAAGEIDVAAAERELKASPPYLDLGEYATVDHHRGLRQGHPEIVYAEGKTPAHAAEIARAIHERSGRVLVTRAGADHAAALGDVLPEAEYHETARAAAVFPEGERQRGIAIVTAGTADLPVAEEARVTCRYLGHEPALIADVGVAGVHRLLRHADALQEARVIIAVAGMEGALASVVGGLVGVPVIALPTSVGYGTGAGGLAALLAMLNSCASNVVCVNIDNGVGAAVAGTLIAGS